IALAAAGAKVVVNDIGASLSGEGVENKPAQAVVDEIVKAGGAAKPNYGSVADFTQAAAMVQQVIDAWGRIDIVVHVAGILRGRQVFESTGKWPSELAAGTDRDPDNVAPIVVYLSSAAAANVNGQVFHARGYGYTLLEQPHAVRHIKAGRRWDPEELVKLFPETLGGNLKVPPSIEFGQKLDDRPADEWRELGGGRRFWKSRYEEP